MTFPREKWDEAAQLFGMVQPLFDDHDPAIQNLALAQLLAFHLASHVSDDREATGEVRERLLRALVEATVKFIPLMDKQFHEQQGTMQ